MPGFIFGAHLFFGQKANVLVIFTRFDKCHETSRIFLRIEQTFASARSFAVIFKLSFWMKNRSFWLSKNMNVKNQIDYTRMIQNLQRKRGMIPTIGDSQLHLSRR